MDKDAVQQGNSNVLTDVFSIWEKNLFVESKDNNDRIGILKRVVKV